MASLFTEDYRAIRDGDLARWKEHFSDAKLIKLGSFMAFADGFGKLVEVLGLGQADQSREYEI